MLTFAELQELVAYATGPHASSFYKKLYGMRPGDEAKRIEDDAAWRALPQLLKRDLLAVPMHERAFPPWKNVASVFASSGTSGAGPLFSPHALNNGYAYRLRFHDFKKATLVSIPPVAKKEWEVRALGGGMVVALDPKRARASVRLAKEAGVDSMFVFLYHVPLVAPHMEEFGIARDIRFIELAGEPCSLSFFRYIRRVFPNAVIVSEYSASEVETLPMGVVCRPLDGSEPLEVYHPHERVHMELIDPESGVPRAPEKNAEGELLISSRADSPAFPLVRYRIGDMVRIVETTCAEHGTWSFQVLGRADMDFIKVPGGMLRADEIERVLRALGESDRFELHCADRDDGAAPKLDAVLDVESPESDLETLAARIAQSLRLAPSYTFADGVARGLFFPLRCRRLAPGTPGGKRRRMTRSTT